MLKKLTGLLIEQAAIEVPELIRNGPRHLLALQVLPVGQPRSLFSAQMIRQVELSVRGAAPIQQSHPAEIVDGGFHQLHHDLRFGADS